LMALLSMPQKARAYDIDCAILLCMAGGFPPSAVCAQAYSTMIRRIMPWPSLPPFGICSFAALPVDLGGPGGEGTLDMSLPEYNWLNQTHVIWFTGRGYKPKDQPYQWDWSLRSCDRENRICRYLQTVTGSYTPWPETLIAESGQAIAMPAASGTAFGRAILVEYGDYNGNMGHSDWFAY
jgi:hypothetical protein